MTDRAELTGEQEQREAFEACERKRHTVAPSHLFDRHSDSGEYVDFAIGLAWYHWQTCAAASAERIARLEEGLAWMAECVILERGGTPDPQGWIRRSFEMADLRNAELAAAQAQLAEARKDAERYRWLRQMDRSDAWCSLLAPSLITSAEDIDAAIDSWMGHVAQEPKP